ncbi:toll-like receptor 3 [Choristoneura fumiferana]|uniref:toll-like receptor 3 n=1 Tax=Choristoneura fumiferana TaxID=7141 RepID=UPI003D15DE1B
MDLTYFYVVVLFSLVNCQDATESTALSGVVCSTCTCVDSRVDCAERDIRTAFSVNEWAALEPLSPAEVNLSGNRLTTLSEIAPLPIQNFTASSCGIEVIDHGAFKQLTESLVILNLGYNKLSTSALDFRAFMGRLDNNNEPQRFSKLRYLSLTNNDIHSIPKDLFMSMQEITHLDLSGNPLAYIDPVTLAAISDLTKLRNLTLSSCDLETIPEGLFRRLRKLQRLDLSLNRFTTVPTRISEATNLLYLNLDKNPIETINDNTPFATLTKLRQLEIRRLSKLKTIAASALGGLESLVSLDISYNPRLTTVDPKFLAWEDLDEVERRPLLKKFFLNNNNISEISPYYLDRWTLLEQADFSGNPYWCTCETQWMVDVLVPLVRDLPGGSEDTAHMTCKGPEPVRGMLYSQLTSTNRSLPCFERMEEAPQTDSAIMFGMMIGVFVTFPMVILVVLLWKRGIFSKCRKKTTIDKEYEEDMF